MNKGIDGEEGGAQPVDEFSATARQAAPWRYRSFCKHQYHDNETGGAVSTHEEAGGSWLDKDIQAAAEAPSPLLWRNK